MKWEMEEDMRQIKWEINYNIKQVGNRFNRMKKQWALKWTTEWKKSKDLDRIKNVDRKIEIAYNNIEEVGSKKLD